LCGPCRAARDAYGDLLADRTVLLTYAIGNREGERHQSAHHMLAYKGYRGTPQVPECAEDLQLMISTVIDMHRDCLQNWLGAQWDSLTFVPSKERPDGTHPVTELANAVLPKFSAAPALQKFLLTPGPGSDTKHEMTSDRYEIDERWHPRVDAKHVLIVDDTWTTGASAQGAAVAAKRAGAATVTIVCVARWLRWDWGDHKHLIDTLTDGFDVLRCPVHGHPCQSSTQYRVPTRRAS
jgi:phosphoribosylpyrophosphate synthetase